MTGPVTATDAPPAWELVTPVRRWTMLGAGLAASAAGAAIVSGPAFLIPELHADRGMSLAQAGLVASAPLAGLMLTLIGWGLIVDRRGERFSLLLGLALASLAGVGAILTESLAGTAFALFLAGASCGAMNSASARVVVGWFPPPRRGLAMGIRQTAQPLGVGIAAATMAVLAHEVGIGAALWVPTGMSLLGLVLVAALVVDPPRPPAPVGGRVDNPYRADGFLARVHLASVLLVAPQFLVWTFGLTWMVDDLGWSAGIAGLVMLGAQLAGAAARIGAGWWSDRVGSRMGPMRQVAVLAAVTMAALGAAAGAGDRVTGIAVALLVMASAVTVADNGLAYTAVAERAGPFWAGRSMGMQNTAQHSMAAVVPPIAGLTITHLGYGWAFALAGLLPLLAVALVPVADEQSIG